MKYAIQIEDVTKNYEGKCYLSAINLKIEQGKVVGIIGKSCRTVTLFMQLLSGEVMPCSGDIFYGEERLGLYGQTPEYVGVYIDQIGFLRELTGFKNLKYIAGMNEKATSEEILEAMAFVGLNPNSRLKVSQYSKRMEQKLSIAQAIMEGQDLLLLHADLFSKENEDNHMELRRILRKLKKLGFTIVLTSEDSKYIDKLCDELFFLG